MANTRPLVHLPPNVQKLLAAAEQVVYQYDANRNSDFTHLAVNDLKKALRSFGPEDVRKVHAKDPRQKGPI